MDISKLSDLGKVGGVPGIAIGAVTLLLGAVIELTDKIPEAWRGPLWLAVVLGAICTVVLALMGSIRSARAHDQIARTKGGSSEARNEDASQRGTRQFAETQGEKSPAVNIRR